MGGGLAMSGLEEAQTHELLAWLTHMISPEIRIYRGGGRQVAPCFSRGHRTLLLGIYDHRN